MRHAWQIVCWLRRWSKCESNWATFSREYACNVTCNCCLVMCFLEVDCACNAACGLACNCCLAAGREGREDLVDCMAEKAFFDLLLWPSSDLKYEVFKAGSMCNAACDAVDNCCLAAEEVGSGAGREDWAEVIVECAFFCSNSRPFSDLKYAVLKQVWSAMRSAIQ